MSDRELPLNSPERFHKRSPDWVRDRVADVGCAGAVYAWRARGAGPPLVLYLSTPGVADAYLDGEAWVSARRNVSPGQHLLALRLSELPPARAEALICAVLDTSRSGRDHQTVLRTESVWTSQGVSSAWRYTTQEPAGEWLRDATLSVDWSPLRQVGVPVDSDQPDYYSLPLPVRVAAHHQALWLGPEEPRSSSLWVVCPFEVEPE